MLLQVPCPLQLFWQSTIRIVNTFVQNVRCTILRSHAAPEYPVKQVHVPSEVSHNPFDSLLACFIYKHRSYRIGAFSKRNVSGVSSGRFNPPWSSLGTSAYIFILRITVTK